MQYRCLMRMFVGGLAFASYIGFAKAQAIDVKSPSDSWLAILVGERFDPVDDEQSQTSGLDLVGDAQHPSLYSQYDDNGTEDESDDEIGFRFRIGTDSDDNVYLIGLDANHDGQVDLFISADSRSNGRAVALWGSGSCKNGAVCNTGPSTTTISKDPLFEESYTVNNYNFSPVTLLDSDVTNSNIGDMNDGEDHFVSFKLKFKDLKASLETETGLQVSKSTPIRYITFSLTQTNSINGDFDGINDDTADTTKTFDELGLFTPPLTADPSSSNNSISGFVFNDTDGDGAFDEGESGLSNVTITLGGSLTQTTTTDSAGFYAFQFLAPGTYSVTEADPVDVVVASGTLNTVDNIVLEGGTSHTINFADVFGVSNQSPYFTSTPITTATQGEAYSYTINTADPDVGDTRAISIANKPEWLTFTVQEDGTGSLTGTPTNDDVGEVSITLTVTDVGGLTGSQQFTIEISDTNDAPYFTSEPVTTATQGKAYSYTINTADPDVGDTRAISIANKPEWLTFTDHEDGTGSLTGKPTNDDVGEVSITLTVTDAGGLTGSQQFTIEISDTNDAPYFTSEPVTTATQGKAYSYTINTADPDVGDTRAISIANKPEWLTFTDHEDGTGSLTGTPTNDDAGEVSIILTVTDAGGLTGSQQFTIEISDTNDAPYFTSEPMATATQGKAYSYTINTADPDVGDTRAISITNKPEWLTFTDHEDGTGSLTGTPTNDDVGEVSITLTVTDAGGLTGSQQFTIEISDTNDAPYFTSEPVITATQGKAYSYTINTADPDVGDTRAISIANKPEWLTFTDHEDGIGSLTGTPTNDDVGEVSITLTVTDVDELSAIQSFTITVSEVELTPTITAPSTVSIDASALFTKVALGTATAVDHFGNPLPVSLISGDPFFQPGANIALWQACDQDDRCATAEQSVLVRPLISLAKDQVILEGNEAKIEVVMNGSHFEYPVVIPYIVSGAASGVDHSLLSGEVIIESGSSALIQFEVYDDGVDDEGEVIEVTLGDTINRGNKYIHHVTIAESNLPPEISLSASQSGEQRLIAAKNAGDMMITAHLTDPNDGDVHDIEWLPDGNLETHLSYDDSGASFNPAPLPLGLYRLSVRATDQAGESDIATIYLEVTDTLETLSMDLDSDGDNIPDAVEGHVDIDLDGIPDYLDQVTDECNVLPETGNYFKGYIIEGDPAVCLRVGKFSTLGITGGGQIVDEDIIASEEDELIPDPDAENVGGIFDFIAYKLPESGQSFQVVLPQRKAIPASAVYRKLVRNDATDEYQWETLIESDGNKIHSTEGEPGYCPPPGGEVWSAGLTEGHWCVQLTLVDGGHYDNDGRANGSVVDPGGVAVMTSFNTPPVAKNDVVRLRDGKTHDIDVLANDTDADGDTLSITGASALVGEVIVVGETSLSYTAPEGYYGSDSILYTISDGEGGTDEATVTIDVYINHAPQADDDFVQATSNQSIEIGVLENDSDADGDSLTITQAIASEGRVTVQSDGTLLYEPTQGFIGEATIEYQVVDTEGGSTWATVQIVIEGNIQVKTEGGAGGSFGVLWLAVLMMVVCIRTRLFTMNKMVASSSIAALVGLSLMPAQSSVASELTEQGRAGPWFITGDIYHASSDVTESDLDQRFTASGVDAHTLSLDKQRLSYGMGLGYFFTDNWFVEGGYLNTGEVDLTLQSSSSASQAFYDAIERIYPESGEGPYLQLGYRHRLTSNWSVTGKVGAFFWKGDYLSLPVDTTTGRGSDQPSDTDLLYGLSVDYQISRDWVTSLQAQRVEFDNYPTTMLGVNLAYHFGGEQTVIAFSEPVDSDRDGVYDEHDACPNTPESHAVDSIGCTRLNDVTLSIEGLVLFANDSTRIEPRYESVLENLARAIDKHQPVEVIISGHASSPASSSYNLGLSQRRAQAVQSYLVTNLHIDAQSIQTEAFGESSLIKDGNSESDHAHNRRVEVVFYYQDKQPILN
ncbi:Ig-like domain-containing protein [Vibrio alginolyticus]